MSASTWIASWPHFESLGPVERFAELVRQILDRATQAREARPRAASVFHGPGQWPAVYAFERSSYETEYAAARIRRIGSAERSMPSGRLVGSKTSRRSSAALVGEIDRTSSRPSSTTGRSAGHSAVASSVGSPTSAS